MRDRIAYRRRLPHFQQAARRYLITFVTNRRWTLPEKARDLSLKTIVAQHRTLYFLYTAVVMPDHVHAILEPATDARGITYSLARILQQVKGASSRAITSGCTARNASGRTNRTTTRFGKTNRFGRSASTSAQNPVRAGFIKTPDEYRWLWRYWIDDEE